MTRCRCGPAAAVHVLRVPDAGGSAWSQVLCACEAAWTCALAAGTACRLDITAGALGLRSARPSPVVLESSALRVRMLLLCALAVCCIYTCACAIADAVCCCFCMLLDKKARTEEKTLLISLFNTTLQTDRIPHQLTFSNPRSHPAAAASPRPSTSSSSPSQRSA